MDEVRGKKSGSVSGSSRERIVKRRSRGKKGDKEASRKVTKRKGDRKKSEEEMVLLEVRGVKVRVSNTEEREKGNKSERVREKRKRKRD